MLRNREMVATKLQRIAEKARIESSCRFHQFVSSDERGYAAGMFSAAAQRRCCRH